MLTVAKPESPSEYKLTIDNEQLTIIVSLRDKFENFNHFRKKYRNCQLSMRIKS